MKATILAEHPFLIPFGTKVRLVPDNDNSPAVECFFAGYKAYDNTFVDKFCFFPRFKKPRKDGGMGTRNIYYCFGVFGYSDLEKYSIEILELPDDYDMRDPDPDRYNALTSAGVTLCTLEMMTLARRHGITTLSFSDYPSVDTPYAVFNTEDPRMDAYTDAYLAVETLEFTDEGIKVISSEKAFSGFLDVNYGERFDVAEALPKIYNAFTKAINTITHAE